MEVSCIQREFQAATGAFLSLIDRNKTDLAFTLLNGAKDQAAGLIPQLIARKQSKLAAKLIEQSDLCPSDFPVVVSELQHSAIRYYSSGQEWDLRQLLDVLIDEPEAVGSLVTELVARCKEYDRCSKGRNSFRRICGSDYQRFPKFEGLFIRIYDKKY